MKCHIREHRDLAEQHAKSDRIGRDERTIAKQGDKRSTVASCASRRALPPLVGQPYGYRGGGRQVDGRKRDEADWPPRCRRDKTDERAAAKTTDHRATNISRCDAADVRGRP